MTTIDRSPTRVARWIAGFAALVAVVLSAPYSWLALGFTTVGFVLVLVGLIAGTHRSLTTGSVGLFLGVLAAGTQHAPLPFILGAGVATVVAWDSGDTAIDLGTQIGHRASTTRLELVHVAATTVVGVLAAGIAWILYRGISGIYSLTVPALLLVAALCIAIVLTSQTT